MGTWDVALLVVAGYLAVVSLVKLMIRRRDRTAAKVRRLMKNEQRRREARRQQEQADQRDAAA